MSKKSQKLEFLEATELILLAATVLLKFYMLKELNKQQE